MSWLYPGLILSALVITALTFGGCITTKAMDTTAPTQFPAPNVTNVSATATPLPVPTKPNLTAGDIIFLKSAIDQESVSIRMIGDALTMIKSGQYDAARALSESAEKNLRSQYNNLSAQSVSPVLQPVKDEILMAFQDEINGTHKLRNIAVSNSEMMTGASNDYREAADVLFRAANDHLNNAQSKINELNH